MSEPDPILRAGVSLVVREYVEILLQVSHTPDYPGAPRVLHSLHRALHLWRLAHGLPNGPSDLLVMVDALLYAQEHEEDIEVYIEQHDRRQARTTSGQQ